MVSFILTNIIKALHFVLTYIEKVIKFIFKSFLVAMVLILDHTYDSEHEKLIAWFQKIFTKKVKPVVAETEKVQAEVSVEAQAIKDTATEEIKAVDNIIPTTDTNTVPVIKV